MAQFYDRHYLGKGSPFFGISVQKQSKFLKTLATKCPTFWTQKIKADFMEISIIENIEDKEIELDYQRKSLGSEKTSLFFFKKAFYSTSEGNRKSLWHYMPAKLKLNYIKHTTRNTLGVCSGFITSGIDTC